MKERKEELNANERPTLLIITFGCHDIFSVSGGAGTGNWILAFYALRLAASVLGDVNVQMTCPDAIQEQTSLVLPWLMGDFPARGGASRVVSDRKRREYNPQYSSNANNRGSLWQRRNSTRWAHVT
jgi:hypothetical protein